MKTISIPYYTSTLDLHVDEANLKAVVTAKMHEYKAGKTEVELVHEALEHPIASPHLRDLAKGKQKVVLVTSDHTRAVPSKITLPILLDEIRQGNPDADITILIATGLHRPTTEEEQRRMFGDAIVDHEKIAINNAFDPDQFIHMGVLPSGADVFCAMLLEVCSGCDLAAKSGRFASMLCCAALSVQGLSVLMQVRTICSPEMTLRPLYRARLLHLPLSLLIFYLLLPQRAQETFSSLCGRVTTMRRLPPDCALLVFLGCCFVVCELSRVLAKELNQAQRDKVANQS